MTNPTRPVIKNKSRLIRPSAAKSQKELARIGRHEQVVQVLKSRAASQSKS